MKILNDLPLLWTIGGVLLFLVVSSVVGWILERRFSGEAYRKTMENLNSRIRAWWVMVLVFIVASSFDRLGSVVLFGMISFFALREFITLTPTRPADHRILFWVFFVILPAQYWLIEIGWYGLFTIFIPVYAFIFIPVRNVMAQDTTDFMARTAKIHWALMICVYCLSHVPALLTLTIPGFEGKNARLLFFLVMVVQMSDVLQYVWGKTLGRHLIAPKLSPSKTIEGFVGGIGSAVCLGTALWWLTPFSPLQAAGMSLVLTLAGFYGGLTMSAIKRDRGVKDYGNMLGGHGGMMDRIDSLCFSAPLFFHLVRYFCC